MTRPKSERRSFGTLLERVFHVQFNLSKGMLFDPQKLNADLHNYFMQICIKLLTF